MTFALMIADIAMVCCLSNWMLQASLIGAK
jgi:hypothetical protein